MAFLEDRMHILMNRAKCSLSNKDGSMYQQFIYIYIYIYIYTYKTEYISILISTYLYNPFTLCRMRHKVTF